MRSMRDGRPGSPVPSLVVFVHSAKPPSTTACEGIVPKYPTDRSPGTRPTVTAAEPAPRSPGLSIDAPNVSPEVEVVLATSVSSSASPGPRVRGGNWNVTSEVRGTRTPRSPPSPSTRWSSEISLDGEGPSRGSVREPYVTHRAA